jgi:hypothetical protein
MMLKRYSHDEAQKRKFGVGAGNPSAIVDMDVLTLGITTHAAAKALGHFYATPKNLLTSSSGLKRADGTGPGALTPSGAYNAVGAAW